MKKVLIVEDDFSLAQGLMITVRSHGFEVLRACDGEQGLAMARAEKPDLIILDIMMPKVNGFEVITELRREGRQTPILVLSARGDTKDKVRGLDLGADDYLTKPFDYDEFLARVRRLLRLAPLGQVAIGAHVYNFDKKLLLTQEGGRVALTPKEMLLLEYLLRRDERLVSRDGILAAVWGDDYDGTDRTVDNLIVSLRKKLGENHIETIRGQGYRFVRIP
jgi:DNA-binding response OmpR family regulator